MSYDIISSPWMFMVYERESFMSIGCTIKNALLHRHIQFIENGEEDIISYRVIPGPRTANRCK